MTRPLDPVRRRLIGIAASAAGLALIGPVGRVSAAERTPTPAQSRGPFYPVELPLDSDNDLVQIEGRSGVAKGEPTHVVGRVLDERGRPLSGAQIEIWQCDANGRYHHPRDRRNAPLDPNFQGYGRYETASDGAYRFRTIRPVPYPGRAPHIHFAIHGPNFEPLVTQMYVAGAPENTTDFLLNGIPDPKLRASLIVELIEHRSLPGERVGHFDIILSADGRFAA